MTSRVIQRRGFHVSRPSFKLYPKNLKGKSVSSQNWLLRQLNDPYVLKARYENYRARSAFKLIEIDEKYNILKPGMRVVECGAAPGAWTQVLVRRLKLGPSNVHEPSPESLVISVDINPMSPVEGARVLCNTDFTKPMNHAKILSILNGKTVDLVCSDMAPNATGHNELDHEAIITLAYTALRFGLQVLEPKTGAFLTKLWDGSQTQCLTDHLDKFFASVKRVKPGASRSDSAEVFLLATQFKGLGKS